MSINQTLQKIKPLYSLVLILIIVSIFTALGRLYALEELYEPIKISYPGLPQTTFTLGFLSTIDSSSAGTTSSGEVVASKNGKKYYFPWCGTVKRIKPENQIKFDSIEEALKAGFTPAANCKGLK